MSNNDRICWNSVKNRSTLRITLCGVNLLCLNGLTSTLRCFLTTLVDGFGLEFEPSPDGCFLVFLELLSACFFFRGVDEPLASFDGDVSLSIVGQKSKNIGLEAVPRNK